MRVAIAAAAAGHNPSSALPRSLVLSLAALAVLLAPSCSAARHKGTSELSLEDPPSANSSVAKQCAAITQCYCIKDTPCGWCATFNRALPNSKNSATGAEICPKWVAHAEACPTLYCSSDIAAEYKWWTHTAIVPVSCWLIWLMLYCYREFSRRAHLDLTMPDSGAAVPHADAGVGDSTPLHAEKQTNDFFGSMRTFEIFCKGMRCPAEERLPAKPSRPYELNLSDLSCKPGENYEKSRVGPHRLSVTLKIALHWRTALGANLVSAAGCMLVCSLFILCLKNAARRMEQEDYAWLSMATKEVGAIIGPLRTATGLLLSFYALNRIAWYWSVLMEGHALQGRIHDIAMIGGGVKQETEEDWMARYTLYRHLMLVFFFSYQPYTPGLRFMGLGPLISCGLLNQDEADILKCAHRGPGTVTEGWVANWVVTNLKLEARQQALHALRELRGCIAIMQALVDQRAPVSFESLLYVAVYALIVIMPFAPSNVDYNNRQAVMTGFHVATVAGVFILSAFYLSLLHMLRHIQAPFDDIGSPNDALNPVALMNSSERKLRDYLSLPAPKGQRGGVGMSGLEDVGGKSAKKKSGK